VSIFASLKDTGPSVAGHELSISRIIVSPAETTIFGVAKTAMQ
jgi:hypothetical protein